MRFNSGKMSLKSLHYGGSKGALGMCALSQGSHGMNTFAGICRILVEYSITFFIAYRLNF